MVICDKNIIYDTYTAKFQRRCTCVDLCNSSFSQTHKVDSIANFVFPYISNYLPLIAPTDLCKCEIRNQGKYDTYVLVLQTSLI